MIALLLLTLPVIFAVVALLGFVGCSFQPRPEKGWKNRKEITIKHGMVSGSSGLVNFPVLISIKSDTQLANGTQEDGFDIQFRRSDEKTILPHEIEKFDHATGQLIAWVQVPDLSPEADTLIYLYYTAFPSPVTNQQDPITLWQSYNGIWHLGKQADGVTLNTNDSTQQNNGINNGATPTDDGRVDGAAGFDGTAAFIEVGTGSHLDPDPTGQFTIEAWANTNTNDPAVNAAVVSKVGGVSEGLPGYMLLLQTDSEQNLQYAFVIDSVEVAQTTTKINAGDWNYVVGVWDGNRARILLNGNLEDFSTLKRPPTSANQTLEIGRYRLPTKGLFAGSIDEVRYSPLALSTNWILTTSRNLSGPDANEPGAFIQVGNQEEGDH